jgi:hypothetical protein
MLGPQRVFNLFHVTFRGYELKSRNKTGQMIGADLMKMHQSIALLRLSPKIDDTCYRPTIEFKLYERYSLEHIYNPVGTL